jgi:hypothetical protein
VPYVANPERNRRMSAKLRAYWRSPEGRAERLRRREEARFRRAVEIVRRHLAETEDGAA